MLPSARRSSLNRLGPSPSVLTTSTVHLSPTRASTSLTARQSSGTCRLLGISDVPSCRRRLGIYLASVSNRNQGRPAMAKVKIAVIVSTTRAARFGHKPAQWIADIASQRDDMAVEVLDLREYPMPFFDEVASNAWVPSQNEVAQRWQRKVAEFDGYIFVTAEYNRGLPAVLKNALDYAYPEGRQGDHRAFVSPAERHRHARSARLVGQCTQGRARTAGDFRCCLARTI